MLAAWVAVGTVMCNRGQDVKGTSHDAAPEASAAASLVPDAGASSPPCEHPGRRDRRCAPRARSLSPHRGRLPSRQSQKSGSARTPSPTTTPRLAAGLAAEHRAFHTRPGMPSDVSETDCEGHTLLGAEYNAPLFGKIVLLGDGTVDHCRRRGLREPRTYVLGRGVEDACASVIYQAETPTFAPAQDLGPDPWLRPAVARITLEDQWAPLAPNACPRRPP